MVRAHGHGLEVPTWGCNRSRRELVLSAGLLRSQCPLISFFPGVLPFFAVVGRVSDFFLQMLFSPLSYPLTFAGWR